MGERIIRRRDVHKLSKSRIYQELELKDIELIMKKSFENDTLVDSYDFLKGGLFNTTYVIKTLNPTKKLVLRVAPIREELLLNYEKSMMKSEPVIYRLLESNGIPTPKVLKCDITHEIINRDYIVMEYIEGISLSHPSFPREARNKIKEELGAYTAKIHNIKSNTFGWITPESNIRGSNKWADIISELAQEISEKTARNNVFDHSDIKVFDSFFSKHIELFDISVKPSLVHNDLWDPNIIVNKVDGSWKIVAIIDADRAMFADSEYEYVLWSNDAILINGYGKELDMTFEGKLRRRAYSMILSFMVSYVHKVQSNNKNDYGITKRWALDEVNLIKEFI